MRSIKKIVVAQGFGHTVFLDKASGGGEQLTLVSKYRGFHKDTANTALVRIITV